MDEKQCPFLNKPCIGDKCAIFIQVTQQTLGTKQVAGMCALPALAMIMSSKPQTPLTIPHLGRG